MGKTLLEEAIRDAEILKQTALENAKNVLVEAISPKIKEFVETQLGETSLGEEQLPEGVPPMMLKPEVQMYEKHDDEQADMDLLKKLGLLGMVDTMGAPDGEGDELMPADVSADESEPEDFGDAEDEGGDDASDDKEAEDKEEDDKEDKEDKEDVDEMRMNTENLELEAKDKEDKEDKKVEESVVEITNEDLKEALTAVLSSIKEATVTKGFGDAEDATLKVSGGAGAKGIADEKSGEHQWAEVDPPAAQDLTVKEAKRYIAAANKQIAALKKENAEYKQAFGHLKGKLQEVNLFNSKLLFTHKLLNGSELNDKQRVAVVEAFDRASNMREVELVYKSLSESFKIAGVLGESRQVRASKAKASRLGAGPSSTILKEAILKEEKENKQDDEPNRWAVLAGITE
jgi:hypothetical protein